MPSATLHPASLHKEQAKLWRVQELNNLEVLKATYINQTFTRHTHDCFGLGVIEQGQLHYWADTGEHVIPPGEMVVINPGQVHWGGALNGTGCTYRIFYPHCETLSKAMQSVDETATGLPHFSGSHVCDRTLAQRLIKLLNALEDNQSFKLQCESYLITTLAHLISRYADPAPAIAKLGSEERAVHLIRDYLESFYGEKIALQQLADLVGLKPLRLLRAFRKEMGLPPHAYLLQVRINRARALLAQGRPIVEVAGDTGFADQSHLTRHFKRFVGVTPGQYALGCCQLA
ncbi:MAG: AraC family transcriptional regulator [Cyanobacteria bacterium J06635_1]